MKKRIIAITAVLALIAVLSISLVGCSASTYSEKLEDENYLVLVLDEDSDSTSAFVEYLGEFNGEIAWLVCGTKLIKNVVICKFKDMSDAKDYYNDKLKNKDKDEKSIVGSIVIFGDAESVKLVK